MTEHERVKMWRALNCDWNSPDELHNALRGLQSTDAPELGTLHDNLMNRFLELTSDKREATLRRDQWRKVFLVNSLSDESMTKTIQDLVDVGLEKMEHAIQQAEANRKS